MDSHSKLQDLPRFGLKPENRLISKQKNKTPEKSGVRQQSEGRDQSLALIFLYLPEG